jgi:eukaryotic-like serine/threonine-protein kinase
MQLPMNRPVALKVLDSRYGAGRDESFRQRFLVEAAMTARLSHPNTVRVLDYGSTPEGVFYLAMEYLEGETLEELLERGPLPWRRVLTMGQQISRALKEAHSLGVVHRDLKPGNIVVLATDDDTDHVKVLDFGLVKSFIDGQELEGRAITQQGMLMGSPPYMAPEQGEKNRADPRSDIYSLGIVLFEALTGKPPFVGGSAIEIILKHVHQKVPPLVVPPRFEEPPPLLVELVTRCLAKSPMDRFQTMDEVLQAMAEITWPIPTPMDVPASEENPVPFASSRASGATNSTLVLGFLVALVAGVAGTFVVMRATLPTAPIAAPVEAPPAPREPVHPPTPVATTVLVHVETDPAGATVTLDGQRQGQTPLDLQRPTATLSTPLELSLAGYAPLTIVPEGGGPRIDVTRTLSPLPEEPKRRDPALRPPEVTTLASPKDKAPTRKKQVSAKRARPASKLDDDDDDATPPVAPPPPDELKRPAGLKK